MVKKFKSVIKLCSWKELTLDIQPS